MYFSFKPTMKKWEIVDSKNKLKRLIKKMEKLEEFSFDTETNTLEVLGPNNNFRFIGLSICWGEYDNYYIPVGHRREEDYGRQLDLSYVVKEIKHLFEKEDIRLIGQGIKYDLHSLARIGITVKTEDLFDTMIASWLCDENTPNGLKENSAYFLGIDQTKFKDVVESVPSEVKKSFGLKANSKATFDLVLIDDGAPYALADSFNTWELYLGFMNLLEDENMHKIYYNQYKPFIKTLFNMEEKGVTVAREKLKNMDTEITKDLEELEYEMFEIVGSSFNPSSSQQITKLLFGYVPEPVHPKEDKKWKDLDEKKRATKLKDYQKKLVDYEKDLEWVNKYSYNFKIISTTPKGAPQANNNVFWTLSNLDFKNKKKREGVELCKLMLKYKKLDKLKSAFIVGLEKQIYDDGKVHPSFNIIGTDSGRLSCSSPNLQQLPRANEEDKYQIRSLFIGSEYYTDKKTGNYLRDINSTTVGYNPLKEKKLRKKIIALDFSNLEMRVLAHFSEDKNLLEMFNSGADSHGSTAVNMFELDCDPSEVKKKYPNLRQASKVINFLNTSMGSINSSHIGESYVA